MIDNTTKSLNVIVLALGMLIFAVVILMKVDTMAVEVEAQLQVLSTDMVWEGFLQRRAVQKQKMKK